MTGVEQMDFCFGEITFERLGASGDERGIVSTPDYESGRLMYPQPSLPSGVGSHIRSIVIQKFSLDFPLARPRKEGEFVRPAIRVVSFRSRRAQSVALLGGCLRDKGLKYFWMGGSIGP